jgi:hypothetical protein
MKINEKVTVRDEEEEKRLLNWLTSNTKFKWLNDSIPSAYTPSYSGSEFPYTIDISDDELCVVNTPRSGFIRVDTFIAKYSVTWSESKTPTTVEAWLNTLPEPYKTKAFKNLSNFKRTLECGTLQSAINTFVWSTSPEGQDFWETVVRSTSNIPSYDSIKEKDQSYYKTTAKYWLEQLPSTYKVLALGHLEGSRYRKNDISSTAEAVECSFDWEKTSQGYEFWSRVSQMLKEKRTLPSVQKLKELLLKEAEEEIQEGLEEDDEDYENYEDEDDFDDEDAVKENVGLDSFRREEYRTDIVSDIEDYDDPFDKLNIRR